jgi:hypothetical protein
VTSFWERARAGSALAAAVAMGLALMGPACASDDGDGGASAGGDAPAPTVGTTAESSPFVVEDPPEGYQLVLAGRGDRPQDWSSDSTGDDEPVMVLAPPGEGADSPDAVTVSLTGYVGFQGGLDKAVDGHPGATPEEFEIDGQRALYSAPGPAADETPGADLVVAVGEDLAVRVRSATGSRDELAEVARRVRPQADHLLAPTVPDPPSGLAVVGHADADVAITLWARALPGSDAVPAGDRGHAAVWAGLDAAGAFVHTSSTITVSTLPGTAVALDALIPALTLKSYGANATGSTTTVAGRAAAIIDAGEEGNGFRALVTSTPDGDTLLVVAAGGSLPAPKDLSAIAASVRPASAEDWEALEVEAQGGPGLDPDPGAVQLERGEAEGTEWLFQARVDDGSLSGFATEIDPGTGRSTTEDEFLVDPCLKLADGQRACVDAGGSGWGSAAGDQVITRVRGPLDDGHEFPGFVMVMTSRPAVALRITGPSGVREVPFHELPGGKRRGVVVVGDESPGLACGQATPPPVVMEMVDAAGRPIPC